MATKPVAPYKSLTPFRPRDYQLPILKALDSGYKRVVAVMPRRSGKDITALNYMIQQMFLVPGIYYYVFPSYAQAKKVIWDSITSEGKKVLDYFPQDLVISTNSQEMKIKMKTANGRESIFQLVGSDNPDSLRGTNPRGIIFSEYAFQDPTAYQIIRPILTANEGWMLVVSTPFGRNHFFEMAQIAQQSPYWYYYHLTLDDTQHISASEIERERQEGIMTDDMIQQEYYCSWTRGVEGAYYAKYVEKARNEARIGQVPHEPGFKVHTAWDIGVRDSTSIIFFQTIGQTIRIIDYYEKSKEGLEHYAKILAGKDYQYGKHIAPHDIAVKEWGSGMTRIEKAKHLGVEFTVSSALEIEDGIEAVRSNISKMWIDEKKCGRLIQALENYRQEWDNKRKIYKSKPLHDQWSHPCDALRYLCVSLPKTRDGLSPEELNKRYQEAVYGAQTNLPPEFQNPTGYRR